MPQLVEHLNLVALFDAVAEAEEDSHFRVAMKPPGPPSGPLNVRLWEVPRSAVRSACVCPAVGCHSPLMYATCPVAIVRRKSHSQPSQSILSRSSGTNSPST